MAKIRNKSTVPQGMLAPNGYIDTYVNPDVQATTRPPGTLLSPSPGYDSVRQGKNQFQGKGPTGGFRPQTFAEDIGGTGAVLSVIPGQTSAIEATEWLEGQPGETPEGAVLLADRTLNITYASTPHQGMNTMPDMGDRTPGRPLSKLALIARHPVTAFRTEYTKSPVVAVLGAIGALAVAVVIVNDVESEWRGRGVAGAANATVTVPADATKTGVDAVSDAAEKAVRTIQDTADKAVTAISDAGKDAVSEIKKAS